MAKMTVAKMWTAIGVLVLFGLAFVALAIFGCVADTRTSLDKSPAAVLQKTSQPEAETAPQTIDQAGAIQPVAITTQLILQGGGGVAVLIVALFVLRGWLRRNRAVRAMIDGIDEVDHVRGTPLKVAIERLAQRYHVRDWLDVQVQAAKRRRA